MRGWFTMGRLRWGVPLVLAPAYVALAYLGRELGVYDTLSVWYPPAGLAIGAGAVLGWRALPGMALGEFLGGIIVFGIADSFTPPAMVLNAVGYASIYVGAGTVLSGRWRRGRMGSVESATIWLLLGGVVAPVVAALFGMGMQVMASMASTEDYWRSVAIWATGDAIGVLTLGPAAAILMEMAGISGTRRTPRGLRRANVPLTAATLLLPSVVAGTLFTLRPNDTIYFLYIVLLPVALVAARHGGAGVALSVLVLSPVTTGLGNEAVGDLVLERIDMQVLLLASMALGYVLGAAIDERSRTEHLLRVSQQHLDQAQALARMGSYAYRSSDGRMTWSDNLYRIYGLPPGSRVELDDYLAKIHDDDRDEVAESIARTLQFGDPFDLEYRTTVDADGRTRWVHSRGDPVVDARGQVAGMTGYCQDITRRRELEEAFREAAEREMSARLREVEASEKLREADATKDALLMAVSHEVRTPLTIIRGVSRMLRRPGVRDEVDVADLFERLDRQSGRLERLLDDLLDVDRLGRGHVEPMREVTDLAAVVWRAVQMSWSRHDDIEFDLACTQAYVDGRLVERIVSNLLSNAERYAGDAGPVRVWTRVDGDEVILGVDDSGAGVPPEMREVIFDAFTQVERVEHSPGTGVGLYLVSRFARLHSGRAWVESSPTGGASFRVSLADAVLPRGDGDVAGVHTGTDHGVPEGWS